ncbi:hypothetical protein HK101_010458 [Irineochytrium annulatum]|nr:hypothetical protein HK101_010458 [Irineochytrium annulatum]
MSDDQDYLHEVVENANFVCFWRPPGYLGQWTYSPFTIDSITYTCCEQWMMAAKTEALIMATDDPRTHKRLGREVANFNETTWLENRERIIYEGNWAKFTQNERMRELLLATGDKVLVEASPMDKIYGVGVGAAMALKGRRNWRGQNLLGIALMKVRTDLRKLA